MKFLTRKNVAVMAVMGLIVANAAYAGDQGTEFNEVWETLIGWSQGTLGKIISVAMMLVGIIAGVAKQSIMAFAMGIAAGLGLFYAPTVIDGVVSATVVTDGMNATDAAKTMIQLATSIK